MKEDSLLVGRKPVLDALEGGTRLEKLWIDKDLRGELEKQVRRLARDMKVPLQYVPKQKLASLSSNANHQGLIAQLAIVDYCTIDEWLPQLYEQGVNPFILVLDGVEDVRNLGALARSAVWFDCHAIVIPSKKSALINSFAYKSSAGAIKDIQICRESNLSAAIDYMKESGLQMVIADAKEDSKLAEPDMRQPLALILGSEGLGLSNEIYQRGDALMSIPGSGRVESLNVSVAGAILMNKIFESRL